MPYAPFLHNIDGADHARAFRVTDAGTNNVSVAAGRHRINQTVTNFATATALGPLPNGTNFVYIDNLGAITSNLGGPYPAGSWPLARVVVAGGDVTGITDDRAIAASVDTGGVGGNTLDQAYDQGGAGAGRTVTADSGRVRVTNDGIETTNLIANKTTQLIDANDEITVPTSSWVYLNAGGAADNLLGIGAGTEGQRVWLTPAAGKNITLIHNSGATVAGQPLMINGEANVLLDEDHDMVPAVYDAVAAVWNVLVPGAGGGGTLDAAYDFGGAGAGRTIFATDGSVLITNPDLDAGVPNLELARAVAYVAEPVLGIRATGDAGFRFAVDGNGTMSWGSGAAPADIVLSRAAANWLSFAAGDILGLQYLADTGGTNRLTTTAGAFGGSRLDGFIGINAPVAFGSMLNIGMVGTFGAFLATMQAINIRDGYSIINSNKTVAIFRGAPTVNFLTDAAINLAFDGMIFEPTAATGLGVSASFTRVTALSGVPAITAQFGETITVALVAGLYLATNTIPGSPHRFGGLGAAAVTDLCGIDIEDYSDDFATNCYSIRAADLTEGTNKFLMQLGTAVPTATSGLFQVMGNFAALANRTPVWISEGAAGGGGAATRRQLRTMDPGAGGANFVGGELVNILV